MEPTRQKLLDTAGQLFAAKGFQATTVREICQAVNVNIAAIHYHFGDQEQLFIECVRQAHRQQRVTRFYWQEGMFPQDKLAGIRQCAIQCAAESPAETS